MRNLTLIAFLFLLVSFSSRDIQIQNDDPSAPVMQFDSIEYDFGTVVQGVSIKHDFKFTNTGKSPLIIMSVYTNTGAAVADWPKEPVPPGRSGIIRYTFNTTGKMGQQKKGITIQSNSRGGDIVLYCSGKVEAPATESIPSKEKPASGIPTNDN